ncbi:MAG: hypothetical protein JOS17DRAFT_201449 [Linnemannia elongata]|nr:MAG: hypothetical protein JOS17DRAFT_201449 [Linnemannia elongata]
MKSAPPSLSTRPVPHIHSVSRQRTERHINLQPFTTNSRLPRYRHSLPPRPVPHIHSANRRRAERHINLQPFTTNNGIPRHIRSFAMRKPIDLSIYNNTSTSSSTADISTPFTSTTRDPQTSRSPCSPHPAYSPTSFVPEWFFDSTEDSSTSDMQWPYGTELNEAKHELTMYQTLLPSKLPPFQRQSHQHQAQEDSHSQSQKRDKRKYNQGQSNDSKNSNDIGVPSNSNNNSAIGGPSSSKLYDNSNSKQPGSVDQPSNHDLTQSQQRQKRQVSLVQLFDGLHPHRLAMILKEHRVRAARKTRSAKKRQRSKKKALALASQPQKKTPATKKSSKSTPSTSAAVAAKQAALAFELLLEAAMQPGNSGRGSRSILREQRKRLLAAGIEVPQQVISILEDDILSALGDMDISGDDSASAPINLAPFTAKTDDSVDENSTSVNATLSTLVQDSNLDHTRDPARFSMKQEQCRPCTGVRVRFLEGGGQQRSVGEGDIWAKGSFDQLRSTLPSCMDSLTLPLPRLPPLDGYEASSTYTTTSATLAREEVGSDVTANESPLHALGEVLRRRIAATDRIIKHKKESHGRAGNRD